MNLTADILTKRLENSDRFFMLASDGIWDYLSPEEIIERCVPFMPTLNADGAAKKLVSEASSLWQTEGQRDDITVLFCFIRQ